MFDVDDHFSNYILPDKIHQVNFSFVVENHQKTWGGTAGNQAFYLSKLHLHPYILASGGYDFSDYLRFLKKLKVYTDFIDIKKNVPTGTGFVITDKKDNQIWMYSKGAMKNNTKLRIASLEKKLESLFAVISPNDPQAIINLVEECTREKIDFAFDPAFYIPTLPKETLLKGVSSAKIIFGNDYEIAFIQKKIGKKLTSFLNGKKIIVKTHGDQGSEIYEGSNMHKVGIYKTRTVDPTGAGDAYRAGFLYGFLQEYPARTCGQMGAVTASFAVEIKGTMNLTFTKKRFDKRLSELV
ncbi:hypothetical protein HYW87_04380 [Candidatus Roizmanbacteria bacterium]|nr:hypothetical protein [Candidatus Roizmanbacteria bacterium]